MTAAGLSWHVYTSLPKWPALVPISPDGNAYFAMARGERVAKSYHLRWLLPALLGARPRAWQITTHACLVLSGGLLAALGAARGLALWQALLAAALFAGLPAVRIMLWLPVLADAPALACVAGSALAWDLGHPVLAFGLVLLGAMIRETTPLFAFGAALAPVFLVALLVPLLRLWLVERATDEPDWATDPAGYARTAHAPYFTLQAFVLPWGVALAALVGWPADSYVLVSLAVGYGLTFVAHDMLRNYQSAAIPVVLAAAALVPPAFVLPALVLHYLNPWRGGL